MTRTKRNMTRHLPHVPHRMRALLESLMWHRAVITMRLTRRLKQMKNNHMVIRMMRGYLMMTPYVTCNMTCISLSLCNRLMDHAMIITMTYMELMIRTAIMMVIKTMKLLMLMTTNMMMVMMKMKLLLMKMMTKMMMKLMKMSSCRIFPQQTLLLKRMPTTIAISMVTRTMSLTMLITWMIMHSHYLCLRKVCMTAIQLKLHKRYFAAHLSLVLWAKLIVTNIERAYARLCSCFFQNVISSYTKKTSSRTARSILWRSRLSCCYTSGALLLRVQVRS